jgi:GNAT superfamily N-acetyltransferase
LKFLSREEARKLSVHNHEIKKIFEDGYTSTMDISNPRVMNDKKVKPNAYLVNDDFEENPKCFTAFFYDRIYKVLRCIYVTPEYRKQGLAKEMINVFKNGMVNDKADFLQIGVENTGDEIFERLDSLYKNLGFKHNPMPVPHPDNKSYFDYFWSHRAFEVHQRQYQIVAVHI